MEAYTDFAGIYDIFMDATPYKEWCSYIVDTFRRFRVPNDLVLDLGCGTGTLTRLLEKEGYNMIGVDYSEEMLNEAIRKKKKNSDILYLNQDMREFELYGTVGAVVSVCDSVNYLLTEEDMIKTFSLVNNYLDPEGIFIFDFNTIYKYEIIIGNTTIAENRDTCSFIWENYYHKKEHVNEYDLTVFVKEQELFRKFTETHYQRGYTLHEMKTFVERAGMTFVEAVDADTHREVTKQSERIYIIARENGKRIKA